MSKLKYTDEWLRARGWHEGIIQSGLLYEYEESVLCNGDVCDRNYNSHNCGSRIYRVYGINRFSTEGNWWSKEVEERFY